MFLGQRIVELREEHDLTQKELAEKLDFNRSVLNRIEQGTRPCRDDELKKLADYFNVTADTLYINRLRNEELGIFGIL